jgi:hypothetical protein
MKLIAFIFMMTTILIAGCPSPGIHNVKPEYIPTAKEQRKGSIGTIKLTIIPNYTESISMGKQGTLFIGKRVTPGQAQGISFKDENGLTLLDAWKEALSTSIAESQLFNNSDDIKYDIQILITAIDGPGAFGTSPIKIDAKYKILNKDRLILEKMINSIGKSDKHYFEGSTRIRSAYRNSVRNSIELFMEELLKNGNKLGDKL